MGAATLHTTDTVAFPIMSMTPCQKNLNLNFQKYKYPHTLDKPTRALTPVYTMLARRSRRNIRMVLPTSRAAYSKYLSLAYLI